MNRCIKDRTFEISIAFRIALAVLLLGIGPSPVYSQSDGQAVSTDDGWIRVATDDGVFSVEMPSKFRMMHFDETIDFYRGQSRYALSDIRILSSFENGTLIRLEIYRGHANVARAFYDSGTYSRMRKGPQIKGTGYTIRQRRQVSANFFSVTYFVAVGGRVFVLMAASRNGETPEIKRFLDSLNINRSGKQFEPDEVLPISRLPLTKVKIEMERDEPIEPAKDASPQTGDDTQRLPLTIIVLPSAGFTPAARESGVSGKIVLRVQFAKDGFIPEIRIRRALPAGLIQQVLLAALRMSFLPRVDNGVAIDVTRNIEYTFSIY
jgi:hypothetical protein